MFHYPLIPGRRWRTEEFNIPMDPPPRLPGNKYRRVCPYCSKRYSTSNINQKFCSKVCNHKAARGKAGHGKGGWKPLSIEPK